MSSRADSLIELRTRLAAVSFVLPPVGNEKAEAARHRAIHRIDGHILPRLRDPQAPIIVAITGPTGAGKSTLFNDLLNNHVSHTSALRPTTRQPILAHHPTDVHWFSNGRVPFSLDRTDYQDYLRNAPGNYQRDDKHDGHGIDLYESLEIPRGIALVDLPGFGSINSANNEIAQQLLDISDAWIFVTTALKYADAVSWEKLDEATERNISFHVVLNRVPFTVMPTVFANFTDMLTQHHSNEVPVYGIPEQISGSTVLVSGVLDELKEWFQRLSTDLDFRYDVTRRATEGSVREVLDESKYIIDVAIRQDAVQRQCTQEMIACAQRAYERFQLRTQDGSLVSTEMMSQWENVMSVRGVRQMLAGKLSGHPQRMGQVLSQCDKALAPVDVSLKHHLSSLIREQLFRAWDDVQTQLFYDPFMSTYAQTVERPAATDVDTRALNIVRTWLAEVAHTVNTTRSSQMNTMPARSSGHGLTYTSLIMAVLSSLDESAKRKGEILEGTSHGEHQILEAVFGESAIPSMIQKTHTSLVDHFKSELDALLSPMMSIDSQLTATNVAEVQRLVDRVEREWN